MPIVGKPPWHRPVPAGGRIVWGLLEMRIKMEENPGFCQFSPQVIIPLRLLTPTSTSPPAGI